jgi:hypothetical protein
MTLTAAACKHIFLALLGCYAAYVATCLPTFREAYLAHPSVKQVGCREASGNIQGGSNMTGTDLCVNKPHLSRSYLNHLV